MSISTAIVSCHGEKCDILSQLSVLLRVRKGNCLLGRSGLGRGGGSVSSSELVCAEARGGARRI